VGLLDGRILAIGGLQASPYGESTAVEAFTPSTNTWQKRAPLPDGCQSVAAATRPTDGRVYVVGGACTSTWLSNELLVYDPALNTWTTGTPLPDRRAWASAAWGQDGRLYVVAGYNELGMVSTGYVYDPNIGSWSGIPSFPVALYQQGMVATRNGLVVLGGCRQRGWDV
jgi:N-acetylneuraminic acid mutarotase